MARPGGQPQNENALRHGATSERQIVRRATVEQRRMLRQLNQKRADLDSVGRALLTNWARAAAALHLMDEYAEQNGWLDAEGQPRGFARMYVSMLNAERLALRALGDQLRDRGDHDPLDALEATGREIIARRFGSQ